MAVRSRRDTQVDGVSAILPRHITHKPTHTHNNLPFCIFLLFHSSNSCQKGNSSPVHSSTSSIWQQRNWNADYLFFPVYSRGNGVLYWRKIPKGPPNRHRIERQLITLVALEVNSDTRPLRHSPWKRAGYNGATAKAKRQLQNSPAAIAISFKCKKTAYV